MIDKVLSRVGRYIGLLMNEVPLNIGAVLPYNLEVENKKWKTLRI